MVTQKDIAKALGLSQYTVSMALRHSPKVAPETCENVLAKAREMGYRPNPMVSALMASRRNRKAPDWKGLIAILHGEPLESWCAWAIGREIYTGIVNKARELGFGTEFFWVDNPAIPRSRLPYILRSRGISAIVFGSFGKDGDLSDLDLSGFSLIGTCRTLRKPAVHTISTHIPHTMRLILHETQQRGYRRPGLVTAHYAQELYERESVAVFLEHTLRLPPAQRVPPLSNEPLSAGNIRRWFLEHRPDVVIVDAYNDLIWSRDAIAPHAPQPAYAVMTGHATLPIMGVHLPGEAIGGQAVNTVIAQLYRNERTPPPSPTLTLLNGTWFDNTRSASLESLSWLNPAGAPALAHPESAHPRHTPV